jgi:hypothetical protein
VRRKTRERLVDGVVHDLEHAVMQAALVRVADIHVGALAHALETLEFLDFGGVISGGAGLISCVALGFGRVGHEGVSARD